jgi:hypothetical protein
MNPSEWATSKIEALSVHFPIYWVEDPYALIEDADLQALSSKLSSKGRTVLSARSAFRFYELLQQHDPSKGKFVIVDQSCSPRQVHLLPKDCKPADFKSISVPHWKPLVNKDAFFKPTVREFLKACTDDERWPVEVDLYPYETLARQAPSRLVGAYESFIRSGRPLTSDDLVMIGASAVFGEDLLDINNPLIALEIAFHSSEKWNELRSYFNESEIVLIKKRLSNLPFPIGSLFGPQADSARLALAALIVLRQHVAEPGRHLPVLSNALSLYQDCQIGLHTEAPSWFTEHEVPLLEKLLDKKFSQYLYDQLGLDDLEKAKTFYEEEHFSRKLRELVPFAVPPAPKVSPIGEKRPDLFSLSSLVPQFMQLRSSLGEIYTSTKPLVDRLRLTALKDQKIDNVRDIFIDKQVYAVDRLLGELHALKRDIDGPAKAQWRDVPGFEARWKAESANVDTAMDNTVRLLDELDYLFGRLMAERYDELIPAQALPTDMFYPEFIGPRRRITDGGIRKATVILIDSLRFDIWRQVIRPALEKVYEVEETFGFARLPSETEVSRRAFFAGKPPGDVPAGPEGKLFIEQLKTFHQRDFKHREAPLRDGMSFAVQTEDESTHACVFDFTDRLSHGTAWSPHMLQETIRPILREIDALLREQSKDRLIFIASDHGHIRMQRGTPIFIPAQNVGYRSAYSNERIEGKHAPHLFQVPAKTLGHNTPGWYVFPRPGFYLRAEGENRGRPERQYRHGGLSLFETVIPLACLRHRLTATKARLSVQLLGKAEVGKTSELIISIAADGIVSSPVKIFANTDDVQSAFVSDLSTVSKTVVLRYSPQTPGRHTIELFATLGEETIGTAGCQVQAEGAPVKEDAAATKLKKIFGDS